MVVVAIVVIVGAIVAMADIVEAMCVMVVIAGFLSDWVLGQHRDDSVLADVLYRIVPNINFYWVVDAIAAGIDIPGRYVLYTTGYALLFVVAILLIGIALFQRREIG